LEIERWKLSVGMWLLGGINWPSDGIQSDVKWRLLGGIDRTLDGGY
jgi:hypothetical protein